MKGAKTIIGLLCLIILISGCADSPEVPVSRHLTFWGTADIKAQVLETTFPANNGLVLKVLEINDYFLDGAPEQSLFEGDEISVFVKGGRKSQLVCEPVEPPKELTIGPSGDISILRTSDSFISCYQIKETGIIECKQCTKDESINQFEGWNALNLEIGDTINIIVRREGTMYIYSAWGLTDDLTISLIE